MKKIKRYIPMLGFIVIILFLTFQSQENTTYFSDLVQNICRNVLSDTSSRWATDRHWFRTLFHLPLYFILGVLACKSVQNIYVAIGICGFIGITDETIKIFLPTREFGGIDLIFDALGFMSGIGVVYIFSLLKRTLFQ